MAQKRASSVDPRRRLLHKQPELAALSDRRRDRHRARTRKRSSGKYERGARRGTWNQVQAEYVRDLRALEASPASQNLSSPPNSPEPVA
jgi:hypothetical protein